ncbi:MAG: efflux RND transporter permease subunit, partial [Leptospiraceae bacterium]|nr:efflux RND transporter permease subunit [Leptospiraceae bacterium]
MRLFQKFLIKRPISTSALFLSFVILGLISLTKLEIRLLPALDLPSITVVTGMPGYAADEVESLVSKPIIETLSSVPGIKNIYSETIEGLSLIRIQLNWGQKPEIVSLDLRERLDKLRSFLPENSLRSIISRLSSNDRPVLELIIVPNQEFKELRYLIESNWKPGLERIDGVALVDIKGGHKKEIQIKIDPRLMSSYGLNPEDIQESILKENQSVPAGYLEQGERSILVRTGSSFTKIDDLENVLISRRNEERGVSLKEFSAITDSYKKNDLAILYSKKNVISLSIYKEAESNTIETVTHVLDYINSLKQKNNEYKIIYLYNEAEEIQNSFINLSLELGIGSCLAFISLLFFLKNIRASFLLISMIPLSIFSTFFFMKVFGLSLNVMSLGGLSLGIGMLIDSGNVVLNSMETFKKEGKSYLQSAFLGTEAVNSSVISAVSSTLIVFIPILFLDGITGIVFKETAITVSISLTFSLFIALSLLPALYGILKEKDLEVQIQRNPKYEIIYLR